MDVRFASLTSEEVGHPGEGSPQIHVERTTNLQLKTRRSQARILPPLFRQTPWPGERQRRFRIAAVAGGVDAVRHEGTDRAALDAFFVVRGQVVEDGCPRGFWHLGPFFGQFREYGSTVVPLLCTGSLPATS